MAFNRFVAASVLAAFSIALWPAPAQAQRRGGRVARPPAVIVTAYPPFYYDPWQRYPYDWYGPYPYGQRYYNDSASLRLQITPRNAEVYVDGYYAGTVDQFDGAFQRLRVEPGQHDLAVYADGFRTFHQKLYLQPIATVNVKQALEPLQGGDVQDARPAPVASPAVVAVPGVPVPTPGTRRPDRPLPAPRPRSRTEPQPQERRDPAPPVQATREAAAVGVVSVRVQPGGADVVIDGERWEGPEGEERLLVQLTPGPHRIEIRRQGYQTFSRTIDVRAGETETLNVSLSKQ